MKEDKQKTPGMEVPSVFPVLQDQELAKNGVSNGVSNGFTKECDCISNKVHNRRPRQHVAPPADQEDSSDSSESSSLESMPTRGQLFMDPANICTLIGATLSSLAMAAMWRKR